MAVGHWGIQPGAFERDMGPQEFWWLYDVKRTDRAHVNAVADAELWATIGLEPPRSARARV